MTPTDQTIFGENEGNCFSACIATILDLHLEEVPNFCAGHQHGAWYPMFTQWLKLYGRASICHEYGEDPTSFLNWVENYAPRIPWIANGISPRGNFQHAVVYVGLNMYHDPHFSREGIRSIEGSMYLLREHP